MSARPGRVKAIIDTNFDKTAPDLLRSQKFGDRVAHSWGLGKEEALKAQRGRAT